MKPNFSEEALLLFLSRCAVQVTRRHAPVHTHTLTHRLTHRLTHTLTHTPTHPHTHSHTHTHTHTHTHSPTQARTQKRTIILTNSLTLLLILSCSLFYSTYIPHTPSQDPPLHTHLDILLRRLLTFYSLDMQAHTPMYIPYKSPGQVLTHPHQRIILLAL